MCLKLNKANPEKPRKNSITIPKDLSITVLYKITEMVNYQDGKVYTVWFEGEDKQYYGSTTVSLKERLSQHKRAYKAFLKGTYNSNSLYTLFNKYGVENAKIELVEAVPCENRSQLEAREGFHIRANTHINRCIVGTTKGEGVKRWKDDNKQRVKDVGKAYYEANKEKIKAYQQINRDNLKEKRELRQKKKIV